MMGCKELYIFQNNHCSTLFIVSYKSIQSLNYPEKMNPCCPLFVMVSAYRSVIVRWLNSFLFIETKSRLKKMKFKQKKILTA